MFLFICLKDGLLILEQKIRNRFIRLIPSTLNQSSYLLFYLSYLLQYSYLPMYYILTFKDNKKR